MSIVSLDSRSSFAGEIQRPYDYSVSFKEPLVLTPNSRVQLLAVKVQSDLATFDVNTANNNNIFYVRFGMSNNNAGVFNEKINPAIKVILDTGIYDIKELCVEIETKIQKALERSYSNYLECVVSRETIADGEEVIFIEFVAAEQYSFNGNLPQSAQRFVRGDTATTNINAFSQQGARGRFSNEGFNVGPGSSGTFVGLADPTATTPNYLTCPDMRQNINAAVNPYNCDSNGGALKYKVFLDIQDSLALGTLGDLTITLITPGAAANVILWDAYVGDGFGTSLNVEFEDDAAATIPTADSFNATNPTFGDKIRPNDGLTTLAATFDTQVANGNWNLEIANTGAGSWEINRCVIYVPHLSHQNRPTMTAPLYKTTPVAMWNSQIDGITDPQLIGSVNKTLYTQGESFLNGNNNMATLFPIADDDCISHCGYWWGLKGKNQMVIDNTSLQPNAVVFNDNDVYAWDGSLNYPNAVNISQTNRQTIDIGCYVALGGEVIEDGYVAQKGQIFPVFYDRDTTLLTYCWCNKIPAGNRGRGDAIKIEPNATSGDLFQSSFNAADYVNGTYDLSSYGLVLNLSNGGTKGELRCVRYNDTSGDIDRNVLLHTFWEQQTSVFADNVGAPINPFVITPSMYPLNTMITPASGNCPTNLNSYTHRVNTGLLDSDVNTQTRPATMIQDIADVVSVDGKDTDGNDLEQIAPFYFLKVGKIVNSLTDVAPDDGLDDANAPASANFGKMIGFVNRRKFETGEVDVSRAILASGQPQAIFPAWAVDLWKNANPSVYMDTPVGDGAWNINGSFNGIHAADSEFFNTTNLCYIRCPQIPVRNKSIKNSNDYQVADDTIIGAGFPLGHDSIVDARGENTGETSYYQPVQSAHQYIGNRGDMRLTELTIQIVNGEGKLRTDLIGESSVALHFIGDEYSVGLGEVVAPAPHAHH
tara:strand:- start:2622 stop:5417 length:2796 start_codon:yes stop_codon:yes gene_type:complete